MKNMQMLVSRATQHMGMAASSEQVKGVQEGIDALRGGRATKGMADFIRAIESGHIDRRAQKFVYLAMYGAMLTAIMEPELLDELWSEDIDAVLIELSRRAQVNIRNKVESPK